MIVRGAARVVLAYMDALERAWNTPPRYRTMEEAAAMAISDWVMTPDAVASMTEREQAAYRLISRCGVASLKTIRERGFSILDFETLRHAGLVDWTNATKRYSVRFDG